VSRGRSKRGNSRRPRILFLACHLPSPPLSGGRLRELELIKRLARRCDVHLIVVSKTYDQDMANARDLERYCAELEVHPAEPLPAEPRAAGAPLQVLRHRSAGMTSAVERAFAGGRFDLVHVEGFYLMQHLPEPCPVPVLLVEQNIEFDLDRQRSAHDVRTRRAEVAAWRRADLLGVLTPEDREMLLAALPTARVRIVPDGCDHLPPAGTSVAPVHRPSAPLVVFVANFGYAPNVDAAAHLCDDILPPLRDRVPDVNAWLVGTDPPPEVRALEAHGVRVTGRVDDVTAYIDAADVVVCPLRIGGGVKVKAIEALRRGKCVVSTTVGAQGLPPQAARAVAVSDDPAAFATRVAELLDDRALRERTERASARAGRALPTWDAAAHALTAAYDELLSDQPAEVAVSA
jgi:glycosyltransferase involved in cell wall biosynthesis